MTERLDAAPERLSYDSARALFERNFQLLNEHDVRHIPTVFMEDIEFEDDAWPETIRGHADMERFMTALWHAMPDFRFELLEGPFLAEDGRHAAAGASWRDRDRSIRSARLCTDGRAGEDGVRRLLRVRG
jgi:hypothetical protein